MSIETIDNRRSIRKYKTDTVPVELINQVLRAGINAPSSKNKQPWRFVVVGGSEKDKMLDAFQKGLEREKTDLAMIPKNKDGLGDAQNTINIMRQAPVTILVLNAESGSPFQEIKNEERVAEIANTQSVGAAIENMLLAAEDLGLGALWICNTFFAYHELCRWLDTDRQLAAAIALGYPDEKLPRRPRKDIRDVVTYRL